MIRMDMTKLLLLDAYALIVAVFVLSYFFFRDLLRKD